MVVHFRGRNGKAGHSLHWQMLGCRGQRQSSSHIGPGLDFHQQNLHLIGLLVINKCVLSQNERHVEAAALPNVVWSTSVCLFVCVILSVSM